MQKKKKYLTTIAILKPTIFPFGINIKLQIEGKTTNRY